MKDVWVEDGFLGYKPLTEEEATEKLKAGHDVDIRIQNETSSGEVWTVHLIVMAFMGCISEELAQEKANKYLEYVFAITGLDRRVG